MRERVIKGDVKGARQLVFEGGGEVVAEHVFQDFIPGVQELVPDDRAESVRGFGFERGLEGVGELDVEGGDERGRKRYIGGANQFGFPSGLCCRPYSTDYCLWRIVNLTQSKDPPRQEVFFLFSQHHFCVNQESGAFHLSASGEAGGKNQNA